MNQFFKDKKTLTRLSRGYLATYIGIFAMQLHAEGYSSEPACKMIKLLDEFGRWVRRRKIAVRQITAAHTEQFLRARSRTRRLKFSDSPALKRLLDILKEENGNTSTPSATCKTSVDLFCEEFSCYLQNVRGLSSKSVSSYRYIVRRYLTQRFFGETVMLTELQPDDVTGFVIEQAAVVSPKRASLIISALRSFFRFARFRNYITANLCAAVPRVPGRALTTVREELQVDQVRRILSTCDRTSSRGRRDFAILLLLARLGLRAGEVSSLVLEDIDWQEASISVRGKTGRVSKLPIPPDVGEALVEYLTKDRPETTSRSVFFSVKAPIRALELPTAIGHIATRALGRARIDTRRKGAHLFRHTLATEMLRQGASLPEIGEILRHRCPQTTMIYAGVDLSSLRKLAAPWPGKANNE